jgi:hypothetical protein
MGTVKRPKRQSAALATLSPDEILQSARVARARSRAAEVERHAAERNAAYGRFLDDVIALEERIGALCTVDRPDPHPDATLIRNVMLDALAYLVVVDDPALAKRVRAMAEAQLGVQSLGGDAWAMAYAASLVGDELAAIERAVRGRLMVPEKARRWAAGNLLRTMRVAFPADVAGIDRVLANDKAVAQVGQWLGEYAPSKAARSKKLTLAGVTARVLAWTSALGFLPSNLRLPSVVEDITRTVGKAIKRYPRVRDFGVRAELQRRHG